MRHLPALTIGALTLIGVAVATVVSIGMAAVDEALTGMRED